jgi:hypothetical protein
MRCAQWAVRDCLPTAAYPVPQSVTEREQSCRSLIIEPEQIADSVLSCSCGHKMAAEDRTSCSGRLVLAISSPDRLPIFAKRIGPQLGSGVLAAEGAVPPLEHCGPLPSGGRGDRAP